MSTSVDTGKLHGEWRPLVEPKTCGLCERRPAVVLWVAPFDMPEVGIRGGEAQAVCNGLGCLLLCELTSMPPSELNLDEAIQ